MAAKKSNPITKKPHLAAPARVNHANGQDCHPRIGELMKTQSRIMDEITAGVDAEAVARKLWELAMKERLTAAMLEELIAQYVGAELQVEAQREELQAEAHRLVKARWSKALTDYTVSLHDWAKTKGFIPEPIVGSWLMGLNLEMWGDLDLGAIPERVGDIDYLRQGVSEGRWYAAYEENEAHALALIPKGTLKTIVKISPLAYQSSENPADFTIQDAIRVQVTPQHLDSLLPKLIVPFRLEFGIAGDMLRMPAHQAAAQQLGELWSKLNDSPLPPCLAIITRTPPSAPSPPDEEQGVDIPKIRRSSRSPEVTRESENHETVAQRGKWKTLGLKDKAEEYFRGVQRRCKKNDESLPGVQATFNGFVAYIGAPTKGWVAGENYPGFNTFRKWIPWPILKK